MRFELISTRLLSPAEKSCFFDLKVPSRRVVVQIGLVGIFGSCFTVESAYPEALKSDVLLRDAAFRDVAKYIIDTLFVPATVELAKAAIARCFVVNKGNESESQIMRGVITGQGGVLEDEGSANILVDPGEIQEYSVEAYPGSIGQKKFQCVTEASSKYRMFNVVDRRR